MLVVCNICSIFLAVFGNLALSIYFALKMNLNFVRVLILRILTKFYNIHKIDSAVNLLNRLARKSYKSIIMQILHLYSAIEIFYKLKKNVELKKLFISST